MADESDGSDLSNRHEVKRSSKAAMSTLERQRKLVEGDTFVMIPPEGLDMATRIFVFYEQESEETGYLYWCTPGTRVKHPDKRLGLHQLTDVHADGTILKLVSSVTELALDLPTEELAEEWLQGVIHELSVLGITTEDTEEQEQEMEEAEGDGVQYEQQEEQPRQEAEAQPEEPEEPQAGVVEGAEEDTEEEEPLPPLAPQMEAWDQQNELIYWTSDSSRPVLVSFQRREEDPEHEGEMVLRDPQRPNHVLAKLPMAKVSDIYLGKEPGIWPQGAQHLQEELCVSIVGDGEDVGSGEQVHFQARSLDHRKQFLRLLHLLLQHWGGKQVDGESGDEGVEEEEGEEEEAAHQAQPEQDQQPQEQEEENISGRSQLQQPMFYQPEHDLQHTADEQQHKLPTHPRSLSPVIPSPQNQVEIEAAASVSGISVISGRAGTPPRAKRKRARRSVLGLSLSPSLQLEALRAGSVWYSYAFVGGPPGSASPPQPVCRLVNLQLVGEEKEKEEEADNHATASTLRFVLHPLDNAGQPVVSSRSIALQAITRVVVGKDDQQRPIWSYFSNPPVAPDLVLTLEARDQEVSLQARSFEQLQSTLLALETAFNMLSLVLVETYPPEDPDAVSVSHAVDPIVKPRYFLIHAKKPSASASPSPSSSPKARSSSSTFPIDPALSQSSASVASVPSEGEDLGPNLSRAQQFMMQGRRFTSYQSDKPPQPIWLQLAMDEKTGYSELVWFATDPSNHQMAGSSRALGRMAIDDINDLYISKLTPTFNLPSAATANKDLCFSLISSSAELHLEAESISVLSTWLASFDHILIANDKQIVPPSTPSPTSSPILEAKSSTFSPLPSSSSSSSSSSSPYSSSSSSSGGFSSSSSSSSFPAAAAAERSDSRSGSKRRRKSSKHDDNGGRRYSFTQKKGSSDRSKPRALLDRDQDQHEGLPMHGLLAPSPARPTSPGRAVAEMGRGHQFRLLMPARPARHGKAATQGGAALVWVWLRMPPGYPGQQQTAQSPEVVWRRVTGVEVEHGDAAESDEREEAEDGFSISHLTDVYMGGQQLEAEDAALARIAQPLNCLSLKFARPGQASSTLHLEALNSRSLETWLEGLQQLWPIPDYPDHSSTQGPTQHLEAASGHNSATTISLSPQQAAQSQSQQSAAAQQLAESQVSAAAAAVPPAQEKRRTTNISTPVKGDGEEEAGDWLCHRCPPPAVFNEGAVKVCQQCGGGRMELQEAQEILIRGQLFRQVTSVIKHGQEQVVMKEQFVWLGLNGQIAPGKKIYLFWNDPDKAKVVKSKNRLNARKIRDMFLGADYFPGDSQNFNDSRCMTIQTRKQERLHLEGEREAIYSWTAAVQELSKALHQDNLHKSSSSRRATAEKALDLPVQPALPSLRPEHHLSQHNGGYGGHPAPEPSGAGPAEGKKAAGLYQDKQQQQQQLNGEAEAYTAAALAQAAATSAQAAPYSPASLSRPAPAGNIGNVAAMLAAQASYNGNDTSLGALWARLGKPHAMIAHQGRVVGAPSPGPDRAQEVVQVRLIRPEPGRPSPHGACVALVRQGKETLLPASSLSAVYVGLAHPELLNTRPSTVNPVQSEVMFSLLWADGRLDHLEAPRKEVRADWLRGLNILKPSAPTIHPQPQDSGAGGGGAAGQNHWLSSPPAKAAGMANNISPLRNMVTPKAEQHNNLSPALSPNSPGEGELSRQENSRCVNVMRQGSYLTRWLLPDHPPARAGGQDGNGHVPAATARREEIVLWFDDSRALQDDNGGLICWSAVTQQGQHSPRWAGRANQAQSHISHDAPEGSIAIVDLRDIFIGQEVPGFWEMTGQPPKAKDELYFSLITEKVALHMEAPDLSTQESWVNGLQHVLSETGMTVTVTEDEPTPAKSPSAAAAAAAAATQQSYNNKPAPPQPQPQQQRQEAAAAAAQQDKASSGAGTEPAVAAARQGKEETALAFNGRDSDKDLRSMLMGKSWVRYTPTANGSYNKEEVFVWLEKDRVLYWCVPGARIKSRERCLPLANLLDIYHGRSAPFFRTVQGAKDEQCLSLVGLHGAALHLEATGRAAKARAAAETWLSALSCLLREDGLELLANHEQEPRRFSVHHAPNQTEVARQALLQGVLFTRHYLAKPKSSSTEQQQQSSAKNVDKREVVSEEIVLWFQPDPSGGFLCFKPAGKEGIEAKDKGGGKVHRLPLQSLTDIFPHRKVDLLLRRDMAVNVPEANCLVLKAEEGEGEEKLVSTDTNSKDWPSFSASLYLTAANKLQVAHFVLALRTLTSEQGDTAEVEFVNKNSRDSSIAKLPGLPFSRDSIPAGPRDSEDEPYSLAERQAFVQQMHSGTTLTRFREDNFHDIVMYYRGPSKQEQAADVATAWGVLYWHLPGKSNETEQLPLYQLSDIFLGRQTPRQVAWKKKPNAPNFSDYLCFSLYSNKVELDLAAKDRASFRVWTQGLQHVLTTRGGSQELRKVSPGPDARLPGSRATDTPSKLQVGISNLPRHQLEKLVEDMKSGAEFWLWTRADSRGGLYRSPSKEVTERPIRGLHELRRSKVKLRLQVRAPPDPVHASSWGTFGYFTWTELSGPYSSASNALDLDTLSSIFVGGAQTALFRAALSSSPPPTPSPNAPPRPISSHCWSLVTDDGSQLNLEAMSERQTLDWVRGLRYFLQSSGPGLTVEEVPNSPAKVTAATSPSLAIRDVPIGNHPSSVLADDAYHMLERGIPLLLLLLRPASAAGPQGAPNSARPEVVELPIVLSVLPGPNGLPSELCADPVPETAASASSKLGRRVQTDYFSLTDVADIFVGQTTTETLRACDAPARNLLALVGSGTSKEGRKEFNLQARSKAEVDLVLAALQASFERMGMGMASAPGLAQTHGEHGQRERMFSIIHKDLVPALQLSLAARLSLLESGLPFTLYASILPPPTDNGTAGKPLSVSGPHHVLLYCDINSATLYWVPQHFHGSVAEAIHQAGSSRMFPVDALADLFMGRLPTGGGDDPRISIDLCLTLMASNSLLPNPSTPSETGRLPLPNMPKDSLLQWGLVASSGLELAALLAGLDGLIFKGGSAIVLTEEPGLNGQINQAGGGDGAAGPRLTDSAGPVAVQFLQRERSFVRWSRSPNTASGLSWEQVLVWLELDALVSDTETTTQHAPNKSHTSVAVCWRPVGVTAEGATEAGGRFFLHHLAAVEMGRRGKLLRRLPGGDRCLTLVAHNGAVGKAPSTLVLEAPTLSALNLLAVSLAHLLTQLQGKFYLAAIPGLQTLTQIPNPQRGGVQRSRAPSPTHSAEDGWSPALEQRLVQGTPLWALSINEQQRLVRKRVLFFYQPDPQGQLGRFGWSSPDLREYREELSFGGSEVTDVFLGLESPSFRHPVSASCDSERCFSIGTHSLLCDFEADEPRVRALWTAGITALLAHHGRRQAGYGGGGPGERVRRISYLPGTAVLSPAKQWTMRSSGERTRSPLLGPRNGWGGRGNGELAAGSSSASSSSSGREAMMARMEAGALMNMHDGSGAARVFVFVRQGVLYWCGPQERRIIPSQSLPLAQLSLVSAGTQDLFWRSGVPSAAAADSAACFSVETRSGPKVHFEAGSVELAQLWVSGLTSQLQSAGKNNGSPAESMAHLPVLSLSQAGSAAGSAVLERQAGAYEALVRGCPFLLWEPQPPQGDLRWFEITLSYDPALKSFITYPAVRSAPNQAGNRTVLKFRRITNIYRGKRTEVLRSPALAAVPDQDCVAITWSLKSVSGDSQAASGAVRTSLTLNLQAKRQGDALALMEALQHIAAMYGKSMQPKRAPALPNGGDLSVKANAGALGSGASYRLPPGLPVDPALVMHRLQTGHPQTLAIDATATLAMLEQGHDMWLFYRDEYTQRVLKRPQRVFVRGSAYGGWPAGLFWCDVSPGPPQPLPGRFIPLADVLAVYLAKETAIRADPSCPVDHEECGWSVVGKQKTVDLEASTTADLTAFIFGLLSLRPGEQAGAEQLALRPGAAATAAVQDTLPTHGLDMTRNGEVFTALVAVDGGQRFRPERRRFFLAREAGPPGQLSLQWHALDGAGAGGRGSLAVEHMSDILLGANAPAFRAFGGGTVDPSCCLTILGLDGTRLDLIGQSEAMRRGLAAILFQALRDLGKSVTSAVNGLPGGPTPTPDGSYSAAAAAANGSFLALDGSALPGAAARAIQHVVAGSAGTLYLLPDPRRGRLQAEARYGLLFYDPQDAGGTVCWSSSIYSPYKEPGLCLRLANLSDVYLGKEHPVWNSLPAQMLASLPSDSFCISFIGTDGVELHFAAQDEVEILTWSHAIQILTQGGETPKVELEGPALTSLLPAPRLPQIPLQLAANQPPPYAAPRALISVRGVSGERWLSPPVELLYSPPPLMPPTPLATMQAIMSADPNMSHLDPRDTVRMMRNGRVFRRFSNTGPDGTLRIESVRLFLLHESDDEDGLLGSLYWCEPHLRVARPHNRFDLAMTDEIILGKLTLALTQASSAENARCCSLVRADGGPSLDLEAESEAMLCCWLYGINCLLDLDSKHKAEDVGYEDMGYDGPLKQEAGALSSVGVSHGALSAHALARPGSLYNRGRH